MSVPEFKIVYTSNAEEAAKYSALESFYKEKLQREGSISEKKCVHSRLGYRRERSPAKKEEKAVPIRMPGSRGQVQGRGSDIPSREHHLLRWKKNEKKGPAEVFTVAPMYADKAMIGDSIMVRAMKRIGRINKNMQLCQGGMTSNKLKNLINQHTDFAPRKVCMSIGGNDMLQCIPSNKIFQNVQRIVGALKERGCREILIMEIPPMAKYGVDSHLNKGIHSLNELFRELTEDEDYVQVVETHRIFFTPDRALRMDLYEKYYYNGKRDLIHPNKEGLKWIMEAIDKVKVQKDKME